jgi:hypothetical protein
MLLTVLAISILLMQAGPSQAVEIDFTVGTAGNLQSSTFVDAGTGLTVHGLYFDGVDWASANLYRRNETNDHGFGICNPVEGPDPTNPALDCPGPSGGGDINELDNAGQRGKFKTAKKLLEEQNENRCPLN